MKFKLKIYSKQIVTNIQITIAILYHMTAVIIIYKYRQLSSWLKIRKENLGEIINLKLKVINWQNYFRINHIYRQNKW